MVFNTKVTDKTGKEIELRNAELKDAEALLNYLKVTNTESKYLICESLLLLAFEDGKHIGNCSLMSVGTSTRYKHRCTIAIALYKAYCGRGIGRLMLETVLSEAKKLGYGQAELEVVTENLGAIALYESVGFVKCGVLPNSMKYRDGTTVDSYWMVKIL